jgi:hypothetical protein
MTPGRSGSREALLDDDLPAQDARPPSSILPNPAPNIQIS